MSSFGGLDGISVVTLDRGWVELGVIMTSVVILMFLGRHRSMICGISVVVLAVGVGFD